MRLRFAPSPTGYLHVGGARTALYNWLLARQSGGSFILRIEDTDLSRSTEEAIEAIMTDLRWLGLDWDEGPDAGGEHWPYRQTGRYALYHEAALRLLREGHAYRCFCSPEELKERREAALREGRNPMYDRRCRSIPEGEAQRLEEEGRPYALRFRVPEEGETAVRDLIRGEVVFRNREIEDFVLLRNDGTPTYNLAVVVDDIDMRITHVVRGDDHLSNTPKQLLIYHALGKEPPAFAHLPMIVGTDGKPLSKRHGDVAVGYYREAGFLPEAMINFLALLGWSLDDSTTIMDRETLVANFGLERVSSKPAVWDTDKLYWMNAQYIMAMDEEGLAEAIRPFLVREGLLAEGDGEGMERLRRAVPLIRERIKVLADAVPLLAFLFREVETAEDSREFLEGDENRAVLREAGKRLLELERFDAESIESALRAMVEGMGLKPRKAFQPIRVAVTGSKVSPPLFESMELLGRERCLQRIARALEGSERRGSRVR
ncbi:glutamate--tRNA ligase [Candidatus Solincola tengchongensis]|uniref:glutamate--tRNA ligase n=1 Tax=Candidatus Solincola tengchongensis TaxID=2900693 RepID=UPI00257DDCC6|nr:glutamate--tRNA ligase [Candidatus Solincola tengchongensis]